MKSSKQGWRFTESELLSAKNRLVTNLSTFFPVVLPNLQLKSCNPRITVPAVPISSIGHHCSSIVVNFNTNNLYPSFCLKHGKTSDLLYPTINSVYLLSTGGRGRSCWTFSRLTGVKIIINYQPNGYRKPWRQPLSRKCNGSCEGDSVNRGEGK